MPAKVVNIRRKTARMSRIADTRDTAKKPLCPAGVAKLVLEAGHVWDIYIRGAIKKKTNKFWTLSKTPLTPPPH